MTALLLDRRVFEVYSKHAGMRLITDLKIDRHEV